MVPNDYGYFQKPGINTDLFMAISAINWFEEHDSEFQLFNGHQSFDLKSIEQIQDESGRSWTKTEKDQREEDEKEGDRKRSFLLRRSDVGGGRGENAFESIYHWGQMPKRRQRRAYV
ncbi:hypothetical protein TNCV_3231251 [Trichonephila clavipes]|nr:hypothetical protein TNCV_3231251 [Trichonephila clavipes]